MIVLGGLAAVGLLLMPFIFAPYPLIILSHMLVFAIACLALNLLYGTAGSLSLGHATYFGVSAYAGAFLYRFTFVELLEIYLAAGILASTVFAIVIGFLCARTTRIFFAILTLSSSSMVVYSVVINGAVFRLFGGVGWSLYLLGGGAMYLPRLTILGIQYGPAEFIPAFYSVVVVGFLLSVFLLWRISLSPFAQALRAIRDNETRMVSSAFRCGGIDGAPSSFPASSWVSPGGLYGQLARQITPDQLHWLFSAQLVLATVLGGTRLFLGPVVGAFAFVGLDEVASRWTVGRYMIFGFLLIGVVFAFPKGIAGGFITLMASLKKYRNLPS